MAPQDGQKPLDEVFPGWSQDPRIDPADPKTWPIPGRTSPSGGGAGTVTYERERMRRIAAAMRQDLTRLKYMLTALNGDCGAVGNWDVAQAMGAKVGTAHRNMVTSVQTYCQAYEAVIRRIEQSAATYDKAEQAAVDATSPPATDEPGGRPPGSNGDSPTLPWRTR